MEWWVRNKIQTWLRRNEFEPRHCPSGFGKRGGRGGSSSFLFFRGKRERGGRTCQRETLLARIIKPKRLIMRSPSLVTPFQVPGGVDKQMRVLEFEFKADLARPTPSFPNLLCPRYTGGLDIFESFWIIDVIMRVGAEKEFRCYLISWILFQLDLVRRFEY